MTGLGFALGLSHGDNDQRKEKGPAAPCVVDMWATKKAFDGQPNDPRPRLWVACVGGHIECIRTWHSNFYGDENQRVIQTDYGACQYGERYSPRCGRLRRYVFDQEVWDAAWMVGGMDAVAALFDKNGLAKWRKEKRWP